MKKETTTHAIPVKENIDIDYISKLAEDFYPFPEGTFTDNEYQKILWKRTAFENGAILSNKSLKAENERLLAEKKEFGSFLNDLLREKCDEKEFDDNQGLWWKDKIRYLIGY